jgi:hypothetical protein
MAIRVLEYVYVYLPLKIAMYTVTPVGRLKILQPKLEQNNAYDPLYQYEIGFRNTASKETLSLTKKRRI